jgi:hypothetical protein
MCFFLFKATNSRATWSDAATAMSRATARFEGELETTTTGEAGVLVRPSGEESAIQMKAELERATATVDRTRYRFDVTTDEEGHGWAIVRGGSLPEIANGTAAIGEALNAAGLAERVMAAVYPFRWTDAEGRKRTIYWIYQPRLKSYTPFVPDSNAGEKERDHPLEIRMEDAVRRSLPTHRDVGEWYPIWGIPI